MIFESIFMIRGVDFGQDFGRKLIFSIIAILMCCYDWKTNEKRKDYFWVFLSASICWSLVELALQLGGTRVLHEKYLFFINITNMPWLTIPLQGMSEAGFVVVLGILFGDRILNEETRKKWIIIFCICLSMFILLFVPYGIGYDSVNAGDPNIPSRRDMFTLSSIIFIIILSGFAIIWLITNDSEYVRKRGIYMYIIMISFVAWWTFLGWITGERWIEVGTVNSDGTYSNLRRAPPLIEFGALAYDILVEVSLIYIPFLAIPYLLGLIKSEEVNNKRNKINE